MRNRSRRSFAVEVKSGSRRTATIIPTRVAQPIALSPRAILATLPAPAAQPVVMRRILPSLIVPQPLAIEMEPMPAVETVSAPRRRGRPPKPRPVQARPIAAAVEEVAPEPVAVPQEREEHRAPAPMPHKRVARPMTHLPAGERWKRRLGRWSR